MVWTFGLESDVAKFQVVHSGMCSEVQRHTSFPGRRRAGAVVVVVAHAVVVVSDM